VIRYHGSPITPNTAAAACLRGRHAMVSYANPQQIGLAAEVCQSFALDNGAFSAWKGGKALDVPGYIAWVDEWRLHPGFDWCLIPDVIDGTEKQNRIEVEAWGVFANGVPVWHLHESLEWLIELSERFPRVALGSSGEFADPNPNDIRWRQRMNQAFDVLCDDDGRPRVKVHGLRMMAPTIFSLFPFASVDSTNIARNIGIDSYWDSFAYGRALPKDTRALVIRDNCESHPCASVFRANVEFQNDLLFG